VAYLKKILLSFLLLLFTIAVMPCYADSDDMYDRAITGLSEYISNNPEDTKGYLSRGEVYSRNYQFELAILDFSKAIELDANCAKAYALRGYTYRAKRDYDAALADYNKAIELMPNAGYYSGKRRVRLDLL
jgi:tetratricopeptide (TPR) repeat protein